MENCSQADGSLDFHGIVRNDKDQPVEAAAVVLFARYPGGVEKSLGSALTDTAGVYRISVPKPQGYSDLLGFRLTAGLSGAAETHQNTNMDYAAGQPFTDERGKIQAQKRRPHFLMTRLAEDTERPGFIKTHSTVDFPSPPVPIGLKQADGAQAVGNRESFQDDLGQRSHFSPPKPPGRSEGSGPVMKRDNAEATGPGERAPSPPPKRRLYVWSAAGGLAQTPHALRR